MKKFFQIFRPLCCTAMLALLSACGILDFEVDDELQNIMAEMRLNYDTIYVERGDTMLLRPVFKPDTLKIKDVLVRSSNPAVVSVNSLSGLITAVGTGWCKIYVESVFARLQDSCMVCVVTPFVPSQETYPYETVYYADVTLGGQPLTEDLVVGAFVGSECRGVGEAMNFFGVSLVQMRVGAGRQVDNPSLLEGGDPYDPDDDPDEPDVFREQIIFRCYDRRSHRLYTRMPPEAFDGQTHGTLSNLFKISF